MQQLSRSQSVLAISVFQVTMRLYLDADEAPVSARRLTETRLCLFINQPPPREPGGFYLWLNLPA